MAAPLPSGMASKLTYEILKSLNVLKSLDFHLVCCLFKDFNYIQIFPGYFFNYLNKDKQKKLLTS